MKKYTNNRVYSIEEEVFTEIVLNSNNVTDALRKIGYQNPRAGRSRDTFMSRVRELDIDISHFDEMNKRLPVTARTIEEMFVANSLRNNNQLKIVIRRNNLLEYSCSKCTNDGIWNGKELSLHLDHIDGDNMNNLIENLRFLCPNCHSQTSTYAGRNKKAIS